MGKAAPTVTPSSASSARQGRRAKVPDGWAIVEMTEGGQRYCILARILPTRDGRLPLRYVLAVHLLRTLCQDTRYSK